MSNNSPLDDSNRSQSGDFAGDLCVVQHINDLIHVFAPRRAAAAARTAFADTGEFGGIRGGDGVMAAWNLSARAFGRPAS